MTGAYRIVVGVDGSPAGERALRWAAREATAHHGSVHVVTAFGFPDLDGSSIRYRGAQHQVAERRLAEVLAAIHTEFPDVPVTGQLVAGRTADVLTAAAADADLLVLGSHGHRPLIGSTAAHCLRRAGCPVVVLPAPVPVGATPPVPMETGMPAALL